jgi:chemotaxis signal transduction protein
MNTVVRTEQGALSLLAGGTGDVISADADRFERAPDNVNPEARELLQGVYKQKDRLRLIPDTKETIGFASGT